MAKCLSFRQWEVAFGVTGEVLNEHGIGNLSFAVPTVMAQFVGAVNWRFNNGLLLILFFFFFFFSLV